jgi:hypothetical protein
MADHVPDMDGDNTVFYGVFDNAYLFKSFGDTDSAHVAVEKSVIDANTYAPVMSIYKNSEGWKLYIESGGEPLAADFAIGDDATLDRLMINFKIVKYDTPTSETYTDTGYTISLICKNVVS